MTLAPERLAALRRARLRALVRAAGAEPVGEAWAPGEWSSALDATGTTWFAPVDDLDHLCIALDRTDGPAALVVEAGTDVAAAADRVVPLLNDPPALWRARGDVVERVATGTPAGPSHPAPPAHPPGPDAWFADAPPTDVLVADALLERALARHPTVRHRRSAGRTTISVAGLDLAELALVDGRVHLAVGVTPQDRQAHDAVHGQAPVGDADVEAVWERLAATLDDVVRRRLDPAAEHPLARVRRSHLLLESVIADPACIGLDDDVVLVPFALPGEATDLWAVTPAAAHAPGEVVVCTSGPSTAAAVWVAEAWAGRPGAAGDARSTLVLRERDAIPVIRRTAAMLRPELGVRVIPVGGPT